MDLQVTKKQLKFTDYLKSALEQNELPKGFKVDFDGEFNFSKEFNVGGEYNTSLLAFLHHLRQDNEEAVQLLSSFEGRLQKELYDGAGATKGIGKVYLRDSGLVSENMSSEVILANFKKQGFGYVSVKESGDEDIISLCTYKMRGESGVSTMLFDKESNSLNKVIANSFFPDIAKASFGLEGNYSEVVAWCVSTLDPDNFYGIEDLSSLTLKLYEDFLPKSN